MTGGLFDLIHFLTLKTRLERSLQRQLSEVVFMDANGGRVENDPIKLFEVQPFHLSPGM
jgi:hypothetical protein